MVIVCHSCTGTVVVLLFSNFLVVVVDFEISGTFLDKPASYVCIGACFTNKECEIR